MFYALISRYSYLFPVGTHASFLELEMSFG